MPARNTSRAPVAVLLLVGLWASAVAAGLLFLLHYKTKPGNAGTPAPHWPAATRLALQPGLPTLLMFVHPRCPCTRASMEELGRLAAQCPGLAHIYVLVLRPPGADGDWEDTDLCRNARDIPGVHVIADHGGRERALFGVETSGHVLLYNPDGRRTFSGGITPSRGHSGDNAGRSAIVQALRREEPLRTVTFVFGCPLSGR